MNLLFFVLVGLGLVSGAFHPVAKSLKTAKFPKIEEFKRLRRNRDGNTWLTNGIHWLIGTLISLPCGPWTVPGWSTQIWSKFPVLNFEYSMSDDR